MRLIIYHALTSVISAAASMATVHVWLHGTAQIPITLLAIAALALWARQLILAQILKDVVLAIIDQAGE